MKTRVDLVVHNAVIYTADSGFTVAQAIAVANHRIVAVGEDRDILRKYDAYNVVDAFHNAIYPGFIDAHAHFYGYGQSLQNAPLGGAKSWQEVIEKVKRFALHHHSPWITGRGWDQNDWPVKEFPDRQRLDELFPDTPVLLTRIDGHAAIANEAALLRAHIHAGQTIAGGEIETKKGRLTGMLIDNAIALVSKEIPPLTVAQQERCLLEAQENCFAAGLTTVADCGLDKPVIDVIDRLQKEGRLKIRLYVMLSDHPDNYAYYLKTGPYKTDYLDVRSFKLFADGALGSRGACLLQPYADQPGWHGLLLKDEKYFDSIAQMLVRTDFQLCIHAIGDSANRMILHVYARALKGKNDRRWRIEHAQVVCPEDRKLFGEYNIVPSVQPTHATSDMRWAVQRLGAERMAEAYAYRGLWEQNGWIPLGTDFPIEDISPVKTFYAAVARKDAEGFPPGGFQPENALTREQALRGMTIWAARAAFEENEKGSLEPGKLADFVILNRDIMEAPLPEVLQTKVLATYVGGEKVY